MRSYAAALSLAPENDLLATRTLSQAVAAGDRPLALQAARVLDKAGKLPHDGRLLLATEAIRTHDWKRARAELARIERDEVFAFLTPVLNAWIAEDSGKGDPLKALDRATGNPLAEAYAAEHRPLLLLARGKRKEALPLVGPLFAEGTVRGQRLQIATAALLARKGNRDAALALLTGEATPVREARRLLEAGKRLPGEIDSAPAGAAELLLRLSVELAGQEAPELALRFARLATFLAPENSGGWLLVGELLGGEGHYGAATAALANVRPDDPFAAPGLAMRAEYLARSDRSEEALTELRAMAARQPGSIETWVQLGQLFYEAKRFGEAADAFGSALQAAKAGGGGPDRQWRLWLLRGGALRDAGKWAEGKAALQEAYRLAPKEATVLNDLGYSQLERRENMAEAERLILEASLLQPGDASITDSLGWAHFVRGNVGKAVELLERAAKAQPADPAINEHLGDAYFTTGRHYEARYAWQAALVFAEGNALDRLRAKIEGGLRPDLAAP